MKNHLYDRNNNPSRNFNTKILNWMSGDIELVEHKTPKNFKTLLEIYTSSFDKHFADLGVKKCEAQLKQLWDIHKELLSNLTYYMFNAGITKEVSESVPDQRINKDGFRTKFSQSLAKNTGENFVNIIVYAIADALSFQDEILVDKGLPRKLKKLLTLNRKFVSSNGNERNIEMPIEGDFCVYSRTNPRDALIFSAKTRLKEIFHIGTMWKIFFDMLDDKYCLAKWKISTNNTTNVPIVKDMLYCFVTADMISKSGSNTEGGDVERDNVRNLIAMDASFFDYVFVSKQGIPHVSNSLSLNNTRESLFHELGTVLDLINQKYNLTL